MEFRTIVSTSPRDNCKTFAILPRARTAKFQYDNLKNDFGIVLSFSSNFLSIAMINMLYFLLLLYLAAYTYTMKNFNISFATCCLNFFCFTPHYPHHSNFYILFPSNTKCALVKMLKCPNFTKRLK